ncbi:UvrD-helicase domain-containing protein [Nocardia sp. NPDC003979]
MTTTDTVSRNTAGLSDQQILAAATASDRVFVEAGPGTGKTTVSAHRFGVARYSADSRMDPRAVVAVSFTRAATRSLTHRIQRLWGRQVMAWPHRVVTLDTIMNELLHELLGVGLLRWPNDHTQLTIEDSWSSFAPVAWTRTSYTISITNGDIHIQRAFRPTERSAVPATVCIPQLENGVCTHDDVRTVLQLALDDPAILAFARERFSTTTRALIVDEVFDANDLDITIIDVAIEAGTEVTLVGDRWQALYAFRGAKPALVSALLTRRGFQTVELTRSFRWQHPDQARLAEQLRARQPVRLPIASHTTDLAGLDVVLASWWKELWELGPGVLPLAFHGFKGGIEEAATVLVLDYVTRNILDLNAIYINDALTSLAISDRDTPLQIGAELQAITETLKGGDDKKSVIEAYGQLSRLIAQISPRRLRPAHASHTQGLKRIQQRLAYPGRPVPALTTHQAKGNEWNAVGVRLSDDWRKAVARGLDPERESDRKLYVACTRAHLLTVEVS